MASSRKLVKTTRKKYVSDDPLGFHARLRDKLTTLTTTDGTDGINHDVLKGIASLEHLPTVKEQVAALEAVTASLIPACQETPANGNLTDPLPYFESLGLVSELLLASNSRHLHRIILACLGAVPELYRPVVQNALVTSITEEASLCIDHLEGSTDTNTNGKPDTSVSIAHAATSLLSSSSEWLRQPVLECASIITKGLSTKLQALSVTLCQRGGAAASPLVNENYTDIVSLMYSLFTVQNSGCRFEAEAGERAISSAADVFLETLRHDVLPKETLTAVAAALYASSTICSTICCTLGCSTIPPTEAVLNFATGLLLDPSDAPILSLVGKSDNAGASTSSQGILASFYRDQGTSLPSELQKLPLVGKLSTIRALLHCAPPTALAARFLLRKNPSSDEPAVEWCPLTDGVLCMLCDAADTASDSTIKHQALSGLSNCLDRIAQHAQQGQLSAKVPAQDTALALDVDGDDNTSTPVVVVELTQKHADAVLRVLWCNWDDQETAIVRVVQNAFGHLLVAMRAQHELQGGKDFLKAAALDTLAMPAGKKGRYVALAALIPIIGSTTLLELEPHLVEEALRATDTDGGICSAVGTMLSVLWPALYKEAASVEEWRSVWAPQLAPRLCSSDERIRERVCQYVLPHLVKIDASSVGVLLKMMSQVPGEDAAPACVALLGVGRRSGVLVDLCDLPQGEGMPTADDVLSMLRRAVSHRSESVRADALALLCLHPRVTALPTAAELALVREALTLTMRCTTASVRQKTIPPLGRLFARIRSAVGAALTRPRDFPHAAAEVAMCEAWLQDVTAQLVASLYPGAVYGRQHLAVELLHVLLELFGDLLRPTTNSAGELDNKKKPAAPVAVTVRSSATSTHKADAEVGLGLLKPGAFNPFFPGFLSESTVNLLLAAVSDPWDRIREAASVALMLLPAPLPGVETPQKAAALLRRALLLLHSPRLKDADAGSRLVLLVFHRYVVHLEWTFTFGSQTGGGGSAAMHAVAVEAEAPRSTDSSTSPSYAPAMKFLNEMLGLVENSVVAGELDLLAASHRSLSHGPLLALRYAVQTAPWDQLRRQPGGEAAVHGFITHLHRSVDRLIDLTLSVLSVPEEMTAVGAADVTELKNLGNSASNTSASAASGGLLDGGENGGGEDGGDDLLLGPEAQVITCACWMSTKEAALVLGTLCQAAPPGAVTILVPATVLEGAGESLIRILLDCKHNGAVDKTQQAFAAVCTALLAEPAPELAGLPRKWLDRLLSHLRRPEQSRRDIIRRSSGLPLALQGALQAQSSGAGALVAHGMAELLTTAAQCEGLLEPWPRVHAFNALRILYLDTKLSRGTSAFYSQGMETSIAALAAPEWEVRNAATLCFTALLTRVLGFANLSTRGEGAQRKSPSAAEFFTAYPRLHPFLLDQLSAAAARLDAGDMELHPSLCPVLALLLRLTPGNPTDAFSPANFIPLVQRCAAARPMAVRKLAARALAPLVPPGGALVEMTGGLAVSIAEGIGGWESPEWSPNHIHGLLLQLNSLLQSAIVSKYDAVVEGVALPLQRCVGACAPGRYPCAPITAELLQIAISLAKLATFTKNTSAMVFITDAAGAAWDGVLYTSSLAKLEGGNAKVEEAVLHAVSPMLSLALKLAVTLRLSAWPTYCRALGASIQATTDNKLPQEAQDYLGELCQALESPSCDVRCAALKCVLRAGASLVPANDKDALCAVISVHVLHENHPKALRRTLQLFAAALDQRSDFVENTLAGGGGGGGVAALFPVIAHHAQHAADPAIKASAVRCLAALLPSRFTSAKAPEAATSRAAEAELVEDVSIVMSIISECSYPAKVDVLREVSVAALVSSNLLVSTNTLPTIRITAWAALVRLLEDEGSDVREAAADAATSALVHLQTPTATTTTTTTNGSTPSGKQPILLTTLHTCWVEKVLRSVIPALCATLGPSPALICQLRDWVCIVEVVGSEAEALLLATDYSAGGSSSPSSSSDDILLVGDTNKSSSNGNREQAHRQGRLFDKEADNNHEEPLLLAQLAAHELSTLFNSTTSSRSSTTSSAEVENVLLWGNRVAEMLLKLMNIPAWKSVEGYTSAEVLDSVFLPLYRLWLAIWAAGKAGSVDYQESGAYTACFNVVKAVAARLEATGWGGLGGQVHLRGVCVAAFEAWGIVVDAESVPWDGAAFVLDNKC